MFGDQFGHIDLNIISICKHLFGQDNFTIESNEPTSAIRLIVNLTLQEIKECLIFDLFNNYPPDFTDKIELDIYLTDYVIFLVKINNNGDQQNVNVMFLDPTTRFEGNDNLKKKWKKLYVAWAQYFKPSVILDDLFEMMIDERENESNESENESEEL